MTQPNNDIPTKLGGTVGGRLTDLVSRASAATRARTAGIVTREAEGVMDRFWRTVDREAQQAMLPILRPILESPELRPEMREALRAASFPQGQWHAFLAQNIAGTAMSVGLGALFNNLLANPVQNAISADPNSLLDPATAGAARARGWTWSRSAASEAARSGITADRLQVIQRLSQSFGSLGEIIAMVNRGHMSVDTARQNLMRGGIAPEVVDDMIALRSTILTPEQLAAMWNRNIVSTSEGRAIARLSGVDADDFDKLTELGGEPLPPEMLGEAFRRGFIDRARYNRGIVQGPIRNEWFDTLEQLQFRRMSTVDAADAVNQNHMSEAQGRTVARANGLDADDFSTLLETAGAPPGVEFMQEALNRGIVDRSTFRQAFLESRIKNKYLDLLEKMRIRIVPQETMRLLYREGVASRERTITNLQQHGFSESDAASLVALEDRRRITETRALTRAQIEDLYDTRLITRVDAANMLSSLGYDDNGVLAILDLADLRRTQRYVNALVTKIKNAYVKRHITETQASGLLDAAGMPADGRDDLFALWDLERTTIVKDLTPTQILQAYIADLMPRDVAKSRLLGVGYSDEDAEVLIRLREPGPEEE